MAQAGQLIHHHGDVISTFVGWDSLLLAALTEGAAGRHGRDRERDAGTRLVSVHRAVRAANSTGRGPSGRGSTR